MPDPGFITRPTEFVDFLSYVLLSAPDEYPSEEGFTNASAFAELFNALEFFQEHTPSPEGREAVTQVQRGLRVVFELYEKDDPTTAAHLLQEEERRFQSVRRYINVSDE